MSSEFFKRKSKQTFAGLFCDIAIQQIKDSPMAYLWIVVATVLVDGYLSYLSSLDGVRFLTACRFLININHELYVLLPPFVLAVIALFPSFSAQTKERLREIKNGRPRVAPFLEQFLYLVFISLGLYLVSSVANSLIGDPASAGRSPMTFDDCFWIYVFMFVFVACALSLLYETFHSLKILYILVIREYFI